MKTGKISDPLKWALAATITLVAMGCVERQSVSVSANGAGPSGSGSLLAPDRGATVVGVSTGGGWVLSAQPTSALVQGTSVGAGLRLSPGARTTP